PITTLAATARRPRPGFIDRQPPAVEVLTVQTFDRRKGLVVVHHLDEPESTAPPGLAVAQDRRRADGSVLLEKFLKLSRGDGVFKIANIKTLRHRFSL